ncbi:MAG: protein translocase subunit SecF [Rhodospirillaceae bacterium]|nr:protein translocase subunit SecF [Rhodospirillaceae bacterium]
MQPIIRYLPKDYKYDFVGFRMWPIGLSCIFVVVSLISLFVQGLNYGIDFAGGIKIEARAKGELNLPLLRTEMEDLNVGEIAISTFGDSGKDVTIRVGAQKEGGEEATNKAVSAIKTALGEEFDVRSTEVVGPKIGSELVINGALAIALGVIGIAVYVWMRFEWQFALGACLSICHDVITTIGLFSVFQMQFDLNSIAAILTIAGFSINDTVVVYDRVRDTLRKYKKLSLPDVLNFSLNKVLSRTILTTVTATLSVVALVLVGGDVLRTFSLAMLWGMFVGVYSTIYIALPILVYFDLRSEDLSHGKAAPGVKQAPEYERQPS